MTENNRSKICPYKYLDRSNVDALRRKRNLARTKREGDRCKIQLAIFLQETNNGIMITSVRSQFHDELMASPCSRDTKSFLYITILLIVLHTSEHVHFFIYRSLEHIGNYML
jgi:hypothetical protein